MAKEIPSSLLDRLSFVLGKLYFRSLELEGRELATVGVDVKQQAVLTLLIEEGPMTQQELGQRIGIDRTTIVGIVDGLDEAGFVDRRRSPADRRAYLLTPTTAGKRAQQRGGKLVDRAERELLAGLDDQDRQTLARLLGRAVAEGH
jgi:DNA-binding MarR family transcriptional regulator